MVKDLRFFILQRATNENDLFGNLEHSWHSEFKKYTADEESYSQPYLDQARRIVHENYKDYGIYVLHNDMDIYAALIHLNRARLPKTTGRTLRGNWTLLAPRYDYDDISDEEFADLAGGIIYGALNVARTDLPSEHIKIHLNNLGDRQFANGVAYALRREGVSEDVGVRGMWLHIENIQQTGG